MDYKHWGVVPADTQGIVWLYLDVAEEVTNVLSSEVLEELDHILKNLSHWSLSDDGKTIRNGVADINGIVFMSGKDNGFIAGADVKEFTEIESAVDALQLIKSGQNIMNRIEQLSCPTVAVINGFCLGGGLELALACDYRVGLKDPKTKLGLPEVKLGIHPGFGGTVRAIELLGPVNAMNLMLTGRTLNSYQAKKMGLLDYVVAEQYLQKAARELITTKPEKQDPGVLARSMGAFPIKKLVLKKMREEVEKKAKKEHYPAPYALIDLWESFTNDKLSNLDKEAQSVANLIVGKTSRNLVRVFELQNDMKSRGKKSWFTPKHIHVVGAGLMGGDIAAWCALQGFKVTVQDENLKALGSTTKRAAKLFKKKLREERLVTAALDRLIPDTEGEGIAKADVIIEAIFEDVDIKRKLFKIIEEKAKPDAIIATNTSSILLETLSEGFTNPERLVGIHFFNPVALMPLVEVIYAPNTSGKVINWASAFTRHINKLPVHVKSSPGFLVNRCLVPYLLEAAVMEHDGVQKEAIDKAATDFGMPMGPIELMDTIGLDVAMYVGGILGKEYGFMFPDTIQQKINAGNLGRKTGKGFYEWKDGKPVRGKVEYNIGLDSGTIRERLISKLTDTADQCLKEGIVESSDVVDAGLIFGTGFAPFRGGPLYRNSDK